MEQFMLIIGFMFGVSLVYILGVAVIEFLVYPIIRNKDGTAYLSMAISVVLTITLVIMTKDLWSPVIFPKR